MPEYNDMNRVQDARLLAQRLHKLSMKVLDKQEKKITKKFCFSHSKLSMLLADGLLINFKTNLCCQQNSFL